MKAFKPIIIAFVALAVFGCTSKSEPDQVSQAASNRAPDEKKTQASTRTKDPVSGKIRDVQFSVEQAILKSGTLELRQGSDFFADLSAEIVLFGDNPAGNGFKVPSDGPGLVPHLRLKQKLEDQGVPVSIILKDPALTNRVLQVANSSFYRSGDQYIESVDQAVFLLGHRGIRNVVLASIMRRMLGRAGQCLSPVQ